MLRFLVGVEATTRFHLQPGPRIPDGGLAFPAVAHDARIGQQPLGYVEESRFGKPGTLEFSSEGVCSRSQSRLLLTISSRLVSFETIL